MSGSDDRVQEALAAHIAHLELGGPDPDFSHLTGEDREKLKALIGLLDQTEGVAFGRGLDEPRAAGVSASTEVGQRLLAAFSVSGSSRTKVRSLAAMRGWGIWPGSSASFPTPWRWRWSSRSSRV